MSVDPVTTNASDGSFFNRYVYGNGNPYRFKDPDGRAPGSLDCDCSGGGTNAGLPISPIVTLQILAFQNGASPAAVAAITSLAVAIVPAAKLGGLSNVAKVGGATKGFINASNVRFSQDTAKAEFSKGGSIQEMADALRSGALKADQVPPIRLVERDGSLFTLDNRRLEAFRRAGVDVPYRMATPQEAVSEAWKFTTKNDGVTIRIRGE